MCSVLWGTVFDNSNNDANATSVAICADGSVVVGGFFWGGSVNVTDRQGRLVSNLRARYSHMNLVRDFSAAFYARFLADGTFVWAREWSGIIDAYVSDITCDSKNRLMMSGRFPPGGDYLPATITADPSTGPAVYGSYWITGGRNEPTGSVFIEMVHTFGNLANPPGGNYPLFSTGSSYPGLHMVQVDTNSARVSFYYRNTPSTWITPLLHNTITGVPQLQNQTGTFGWVYEFTTPNDVSLCASWNNVAFFRSATPFKSDPELSEGGAGGYFYRGDNNWRATVAFAQTQGVMKLWRGIRTIISTNSDGDHLWSNAANITGNNVWVSSNNGLVSLAGAVFGAPSVAVFRFLDQGSLIWSVQIQGLGSENRTDISVSGVATDSDGNVAVVGRMGYAPLAVRDITGQQVATIASFGTFSAFIVSFDISGKYRWSATISSWSNFELNTVAVDRLGNVAVGGSMASVTTIYNTNGTAVQTFSNAALFGGYIFRFSSTGDYIDQILLRGVGSVIVKRLHYDSVGRLYASGDFLSSSISISSPYDSYPDVVTSAGNRAGFAMRFNVTASIKTVTVSFTSTILATPNPSTTVPIDQSRNTNILDSLLALGEITLIVIGVLIALFLCFCFFGFYLIAQRAAMKKMSKMVDGTYFTVDMMNSTRMMDNMPKMVGSMPTHIELRNNYDFKQGERLPTGPDTFLFKCILRGTQAPSLARGETDLVIKVFAKSETVLKADQKARFNLEVSALWKLRQNKSIMKIIGYSREPVGLIMKRYGFGSLSHWIYASSEAPAELAYSKANISKMILDVAKAVSFIHQNKVIHGDISSGNILLDRYGLVFIPVLTDFSNARMADAPDTTRVIKNESIAYAAPEVLASFASDNETQGTQKSQVAKSGDVYSLGIIILELIQRRLWALPASKLGNHLDDAFAEIENMFDF